MKKLLFPLAVCLFAACSTTEKQASYSIVPLPQEINLTQDKPFLLNKKTKIVYPGNNTLLKRNAEFLAEYIRQATGFILQTRAIKSGEILKQAIVLGINPSISNKEGYVLTTSADGIRINGQTENGVFYGIQTLRKSIPAEAKKMSILIPSGEVEDEPRFSYRGMHLDVGRHFFSVEFIKEYIDLLALHNMNTFHWHLTDDQGWRIEIKKYPRLTKIGSMRSRTVIGKNSEQYDNTPYGGFYTQRQAREIIEYAQERYITIIPEIDLPGHMLAALAAYPEFGCTGGPYEVCPNWGIFEDVLCIGNEKTMRFLEDVMVEIIEIFPSKMIHIGGDEAPRVRWQKCPKCQALIRSKGLKSDKHHTAEDRLQNYCTSRIAKFLSSKGRQIIGWDEILEGEITPNATVMSWRGMDGGLKAAQMGHDAIMAPNTYAYLDYYQTDDTKDEPFAIGGYVPVEKVYSLEPVPATLTEAQKKHILGVQANLWSEYIPTTQHAEYMVLPRMAALSEVQWTQPEKKNYKQFSQRLLTLMQFYQRDSLNYAKHVFDLKAEYARDIKNKAINVTLSTIDDSPVYYTLDGTEPTTASTRYSGPIAVKETVDLCAIAIRPERKSKLVKKNISINKSTLCPIELTTTQPAKKYRFDGAITLVDGMKGPDSYATGSWLGFIDGDVTATIDFGAQTNIKHVATNAIVDMGAWIMGSTGLVISVSNDKKDFREVAARDFPAETIIEKKGIEKYEITFEPIQTRYVKILIRRSPGLPKGHIGEGKRAYLFIDEIEIN